VSHKGGNQSTNAHGGSEPNKEVAETHKLMVGIAALVIGFGVATLSIQWATWDLVRRIFHKKTDGSP
jgi:hypothetical protein